MLKALTIFLGLLAIVSRGLILIFPSSAKDVLTAFASNNLLLRGTSVFLLVFSVLLFYAVRAGTAIIVHVMTVVAVVMFLSGLWILFVPAQYGSVVEWFMRFPEPTIQFFAGVGVCIGVLILILGIKYY